MSRQFVCPSCGCDDINELSVCVVTRRVIKWSDSGEPDDYDRAEVDWESDMPYVALRGPRAEPKITFECGHCAEQFETPKRIE